MICDLDDFFLFSKKKKTEKWSVLVGCFSKATKLKYLTYRSAQEHSPAKVDW